MSGQISWQLYGTRQCHLCEQAELLLQQAAAAFPIRWSPVDINELPAEHYARLEQRIPVLSTPQGELQWPFGLPDIARLIAAG